MLKRSIALLILAFGLPLSKAVAEDCGVPPYKKPSIPANADTITLEELRVLRSSVINYSGAVDAYLDCMDREGERLSRFMSKEQLARRTEDLNTIHERRREVQIQMNNIIRLYRERTDN